jgi:hypothetical protein
VLNIQIVGRQVVGSALIAESVDTVIPVPLRVEEKSAIVILRVYAAIKVFPIPEVCEF